MRKVWVSEYSSLKDLVLYKFVYYNIKIINKMGEQFKIIEYPGQTIITLRDELSNSGELLKLLIPNLENIFRGGWTNYSSMVTSQKMVLLFYLIKYNIYGMYISGTLKVVASCEAKASSLWKMDNRGSKSNKGNTLFVKEQRVDGSWLLNHYAFNSLRCTLRRFERITLSGFLSNQILNKRLYSTTTILNTKNPKNIQSLVDTDGYSLNPWFVTGFTDGDGSFAVSITKKKEGIGWKIVPMFTIGLDQKDLDLLVQIDRKSVV